MNKNKQFKSFRNELHESEYKEVLTGYPNRGIDTDVGPTNDNLLMKVNAVLNTLNNFTHQNTNEALIKIRTRLNLFMLDFPWTPWMWQNGTIGTINVPVTMYGRVDGVDALTGGINFGGTANPTSGLQQFTLYISVETAEDGLYRVTSKLLPRDGSVLPEGVEEDGDAVTEDYQTDARVQEEWKSLKKTRADLNAIRAKGKRVSLWHGEGDTLYRVSKPKKKKPVQEETEQIIEKKKMKTWSPCRKVVDNDEKMKKKVVDEATHSKYLKTYGKGKVGDRKSEERSEIARQKREASILRRGGASPESIKQGVKWGDWPDRGAVTAKYNFFNNAKFSKLSGKKSPRNVKEESDNINEISKKTKDSYVAKRGSQLSSMMYGSEKNRNLLTGKKQANAVKGIKRAIGVSEDLVGGQKKLDANKNKRLDAHDFVLLRAKKKKTVTDSNL